MTASVTAAVVEEYLQRLFPLNRSISGEGNRQTLKILQEIVPLTIAEYSAGTDVYDWVIPDEWYIRDAWIKDSTGERIVDFSQCNLHVVGYSEPVRKCLSFDKLEPKLHYLPELPEAIPYRTTYYQRDWGFCVNVSQYEALRDAKGELEVVIDSGFDPEGSMTVGELLIPGRKEEEYLVSTYICHPSMANDNLSGVLTAAFLGKMVLDNGTPEHSWRFVFVPETIGAIAYLRHNESVIGKIKGGLVISCCGGKGQLGYKESYLVNNLVDRAIRLTFRDLSIEPIRYPFAPVGSDERQYSSPEFRIPVATICKDKYHEYKEYHTSLDNLDFVNGSQIKESIKLYKYLLTILDQNRFLKSMMKKGEVHLGKRGLYPSIGGANKQSSRSKKDNEDKYSEVEVFSWLLFFADGISDLIFIAERSGISFDRLRVAAATLHEKKLIKFDEKTTI